MANVDAFNSGFDSGHDKGKAKKDAKDQKDKGKGGSDAEPKLGGMLTPAAKPDAYKKGGKVKRTGVALVHKGEVVLTAKQAKKKKTGAHKRVASKG